MSMDWSKLPQYAETFLIEKIGDPLFARKPVRFTGGIDPGIERQAFASYEWHSQTLTFDTPPERPLVRLLREERERLIRQWEVLSHKSWALEQHQRTMDAIGQAHAELWQEMFESLLGAPYVSRP